MQYNAMHLNYQFSYHISWKLRGRSTLCAIALYSVVLKIDVFVLKGLIDRLAFQWCLNIHLFESYLIKYIKARDSIQIQIKYKCAKFKYANT